MDEGVLKSEGFASALLWSQVKSNLDVFKFGTAPSSPLRALFVATSLL
jgi:hypothetical protein